MDIDINEVITDGSILTWRCIEREGFLFTSISEPHNVYDALLMRNPGDLVSLSPRFPNSLRSLEDHIQLVNDLQLEKALIIAEDINFLPRCPSLNYLSVIPADSAGDGFDFSPLYKMPHVQSVCCTTVYGKNREKGGCVDYLQIHGLRKLAIAEKGHMNVEKLFELQELYVSDFIGHNRDLTDLIGSDRLEKLCLLACKCTSLRGIDRSHKLNDVELWYNRSLNDISQLAKTAATLKRLSIQNCPKITDFSYLQEMVNLEYLELLGSNALPDLKFLENMPKLKRFDFSMNVTSGDLSPCLRVPYVRSLVNRKHYNLKDKELPPFTAPI